MQRLGEDERPAPRRWFSNCTKVSLILSGAVAASYVGSNFSGTAAKMLTADLIDGCARV